MNENLAKTYDVTLMPGLHKRQTNSAVQITYHWYGGLGGITNRIVEIFVFILGLVFSFFSLNGMIAFFTGPGIFFQSLMSFLFLLIGFVLVYRGLSLVFNRSVFYAGSQGLTVHHGPLPFPGVGNLDLKHAEIMSVEWRKVGHSTDSQHINGFSQTGYSATFDVILTTNIGKIYTLLSAIQAREYAFAIASEISKSLHK
jgi:hypothetical protein